LRNRSLFPAGLQAPCLPSWVQVGTPLAQQARRGVLHRRLQAADTPRPRNPVPAATTAAPTRLLSFLLQPDMVHGLPRSFLPRASRSRGTWFSKSCNDHLHLGAGVHGPRRGGIDWQNMRCFCRYPVGQHSVLLFLFPSHQHCFTPGFKMLLAPRPAVCHHVARPAKGEIGDFLKPNVGCQFGSIFSLMFADQCPPPESCRS